MYKELSSEIKYFENYCNEFYNINYGLYKIATKKEIKNAIKIFFLLNDFKNIEFHSVDREKVRQILNK